MDPLGVQSESASTRAQDQANRGRHRKLTNFHFTHPSLISARPQDHSSEVRRHEKRIARWLDNDVQPTAPEEEVFDNSAWNEPLSAVNQAVAPGSHSDDKQTKTPNKNSLVPLNLGIQGQSSLLSPDSDIAMQHADTKNPDSDAISTPKVRRRAMLPFGRGKPSLTAHDQNGPTGGIVSPPPTPVTLRQANVSMEAPSEFASIMSLEPGKRQVSYKGNRDADTGVTCVLSFPRGILRRKRAFYEAAVAVAADAADNQPPAKKTRASKRHDGASEDPAVATAMKGFPGLSSFFVLSLEIRDKIYGYLLESNEAIRVRKHWTQRYARCRPEIHPAVLCVCKQAYAEASRVLYGNNTFQYLLRDTSDAATMPWGSSGRARRARPVLRDNGDGLFIDVSKYGHLLRKLEIVVEANRTGEEYKICMEKALTALTPEEGGFQARLDTITLTVSPRFEKDFQSVTTTVGEMVLAYLGRYLSVVDFFSSGGKIVKTLEKINVNYVRINVHTEGISTAEAVKDGNQDDDDDGDENCFGDESNPNVAQPFQQIIRKGELEDSGPRHLETTLDLRYLPGRIEALKAASDGVWMEDHLSVEARNRKGDEARAALKGLRLRVQNAVTRPRKSILDGLWVDHHEAEACRREKRAKAQNMLTGDDSPRGVTVEDDHSDKGSDDNENNVRGTLMMKFTRCNNCWAARVA